MLEPTHRFDAVSSNDNICLDACAIGEVDCDAFCPDSLYGLGFPAKVDDVS
jgi:hypothetical protein